jgi:type IV pilus assembly protein PilB
MGERRNIGEVLLDLGRITEDDVERAVRYQRENGGFFGEALIALGFVTAQEVEFGLASQHDLPYVFPQIGDVDTETAAMVTPEWALAHMILPMVRTDQALTVLVDSPLWNPALDELQARTDLSIQLALASRMRIRELITEVYGRTDQEGTHFRAVSSVESLLSEAVQIGATRIGISSRGPRAWGWFEDHGTVKRRPLDGGWEVALSRVLTPHSSEGGGELAERASWSGFVNHEGLMTPVEVSCLASRNGSEYLICPVREPSMIEERFPPAPAALVTEIRLLARTGTARIAVTSDPESLAREILPYLPMLLLDPAWRALHLTDRLEDAPESVLTYEILEESQSIAAVEELHAFRFDVITVDLSTPQEAWLSDILALSPVTFVRYGASGDLSKARMGGLRWGLGIREQDEGKLAWHLDPLQSPDNQG